MRHHAVHLDRARVGGETDAAGVALAEPRSAVEADRVVVEERVDPVVGHDPHFLEAIPGVGRELPEAEVEPVLAAERIDVVQPRVLDLDLGTAVRKLAVGELAEEAHVVSERARGEEIELLGKLEVVVEDLMARVVLGRGIEVRELDVDRQWHVAGKGARIDHLRPHLFVGLGAERYRHLLDLLLRLAGHAVAVEPKRLAEGIELRKDGVAGLAGRVVLAREHRDRVRGAHARAEDHEPHGEEREDDAEPAFGAFHVSPPSLRGMLSPDGEGGNAASSPDPMGRTHQEGTDLDDALLKGEGDRFRLGVDLELLQDVLDVVARGQG